MFDIFGNKEGNLRGQITFKQSLHGFNFSGDSIYNDIESKCNALVDFYRQKLFCNPEEDFHEIPLWVYACGHSSEDSSSQKEFEKKIQNEGSEETNRHLYYPDLISLIDSLKDRIICIKSSYIDFYQKLSELPILVQDDKVYWTSGEKSSGVFSSLYNTIFLTYSSLDLLSKLVHENKHMPNEFRTYPGMKSINTQFNQAIGKQALDKVDNTIFEDDKSLKMFQVLRNALIHDGAWETIPKIFYQVENSMVTSKWIFAPDGDGRLDKYKNRKRFFSQGVKINEVLPTILSDVLERISKTLTLLQK